MEPLAQTRTVIPSMGAHKIKLFPNPVADNFTLEINAIQAGKMNIRVYDILGKAIAHLSREQPIDKGLSTINLPAESLSTGLYYCKIRIGEVDFTKSFVRVEGN